MHSSIGACHNIGSCGRLISAGTVRQAIRCASPIAATIGQAPHGLPSVRGRRILIAINVMTLFDQIDRALTLSANQFAGRSVVLDKFVNDIVYLPLLNGGVFLAAFWWLWFEADESGAYAQRRNVVAALLGTIVVGVVSHLLKVAFAIALSPAALPGYRHTTAVRC